MELEKAVLFRDKFVDALKQYLVIAGDQKRLNLHDFIISEMEPALFESVLKKTKGNHTHSAKMLGITRTTFRNKLKMYGLFKARWRIIKRRLHD